MPPPQRTDILGEVARLNRELERLQKSVGHVESIRNITLLSPWVVFGGSQRVPGYYRDPFGRIWLAGIAKGGSTGTTIGYLDSDCWPAVDSYGVGSGDGGLARFKIQAVDGAVVFLAGTAVTELIIDGISFRVG